MGCRKKSYFLEFMYSDFARDFVGVVFMSFFTVPRAPTTTGTVVVLSAHIRSISISKSLYLLSFSVVVTRGFGLEGYSHVNEKAMSFLFFSTMSGLLAAMVLAVWMGMSLRIVTLSFSVTVLGSCSPHCQTLCRSSSACVQLRCCGGGCIQF